MSTYIENEKPLEFDGAPDWLVGYMRYRKTVYNNSRQAVMTYFKNLREFFKWAAVFKQTGLNPKNEKSLRNVDILDLPLELALSIKKSDIETYLYFTADVLKNEVTTRNKKLAAIQGFYDYLLDQQEYLCLTIESNPANRIRRPKPPKKRPIYLSKQDQEQFLTAIAGENDDRDYAMFLLCLSTGIRNSELVELNVKDLNLKSKKLFIKKGKGDKQRVAELTDPCCEALKEYLSNYRSSIDGLDTDALFVSKRYRTRITTRAVQKAMKKHTVKAGLGGMNYTPHKLRHSTATTLAKEGIDVAVIQRVLGHESANTTMVYTHLDGNDISKAIARTSLSTIGGKRDFTSEDTDTQNKE